MKSKKIVAAALVAALACQPLIWNPQSTDATEIVLVQGETIGTFDILGTDTVTFTEGDAASLGNIGDFVYHKSVRYTPLADPTLVKVDTKGNVTISDRIGEVFKADGSVDTEVKYTASYQYKDFGSWTVQLKVTREGGTYHIYDSNGVEISKIDLPTEDDFSYEWTSTNPDVAAVGVEEDGTNRLHAYKDGEADITLTGYLKDCKFGAGTFHIISEDDGRGEPATEQPKPSEAAPIAQPSEQLKDTEAPKPSEPATEAPGASEDPTSETPATETVASETPATEVPASEMPASEEPGDKKLGDVDDSGDVDLDDAQIVLKAALKITQLTPEEAFLADVDGNGDVDLDDAQTTLKKALKIIP